MGNTVVVKPSEYTPLSVLGFGRRPQQRAARRRPGASCPGPATWAPVFSGRPDIDKVMFAGSTATGQTIIASLGRHGEAPDVGTRRQRRRDRAARRRPPRDRRRGSASGARSSIPVRRALRSSACTSTTTSTTITSCAPLVEVAKSDPHGPRAGGAERSRGPADGPQRDIVARTGGRGHATPVPPSCWAANYNDPDLPRHFYPTTIVCDISNDNPLVAEEQFGPALPVFWCAPRT